MSPEEFVNLYAGLASGFLRWFSRENPGRNVVFSPFSILSLLSVLTDASSRRTRGEILNALYDRGPRPRGLPEMLKAVGEELSRAGDDDAPYLPDSGEFIRDRSPHFHTANAVLLRQDCRASVRPEFRKYLREFYGGEVILSGNLRAVMDYWPKETALELWSLLEEAACMDSAMALVNTVAFNAMWERPYDDEDVREGAFRNADRTVSRAGMLHGTESCFVENEHATGFVKNFQQCGYSFLALLPRKEGPDALAALAESMDFRTLPACSRRSTVHTAMPEFAFPFSANLIPPCRAFGIRELFTDHPDLTPMTDDWLEIEQFVHRAKIEVNRKGASASAATMLMCVGACPPEDEQYVTLDRPFLFAVLSDYIGLPVFAGIVNRIEET